MTLKVSSGHVDVPLTCAGGQGCSGQLTITYRVRHGHHSVTVACTKHGGTSYNLPANKRTTVRVALRGRCLAAIRRHHRLSATLLADAHGQGALTKPVILVL